MIGAPAARAVAEAARGAVRVHVPVRGHAAGEAAGPRLRAAQPRRPAAGGVGCGGGVGGGGDAGVRGRVCVCLPCMSALDVCLICLPYMSALSITGDAGVRGRACGAGAGGGGGAVCGA